MGRSQIREREQQRAAAILDEGAATTADELLDLIHEINPTRRRLARDVAKARYAIKDRLQSYLLRHFADEICITPMPFQRGVVSLSHRHTARNACHTVLEGLDPDVRHLVEAEIRRAAPHRPVRPSRPAVEAPPAPVEDRPALTTEPGPEQGPLRRGLWAQDTFDYEAARDCFTQALAESGGGAEEALALLRLLIDHLAADREALDLLPDLSDEALAANEVRLLLAIAAARQDERALALDLLGGITGSPRPREAVVHLLLCRAALRGEALDLDRASADLERARERDPAHPDLPALREEIAAARRSERLPLEQEIVDLCAAGDLPQAESCARAVLERYPDSEPARRALRMIGDQRRLGEAQHLLAQAEAAAARGQRGAAVSLLQQALSAGVPTPGASVRRGESGGINERIKERIAALEQEELAQRQRARVRDCIALLHDKGDVPAGLQAYLALPPPLREQVEDGAPLPHYAILREVEKTRSGVAQRELIEAACALVQAEQVAAADPEAALSLLEKHARALLHVPLRRAVESTAQQRILAQWHACVVAQLTEAHGALADGDLPRAQQLLAELDFRALDPDELAAAEALRGGAELVLERRQLTQRFVQLFLAGNVFAARGVVDQILARHPGFGQEFWREQRAQLVAIIQRTFAVRVSRGPGPRSETWDIDPARELRPTPQRLLWPGAPARGEGPAVVLPAIELDRVFVRLIDCATGAVRARAWLRLPGPIVARSATADDASLWILGHGSEVLQLSLPDFEVLRWQRSDEGGEAGGGRGEPTALAEHLLSPDSRSLWQLSQGEEQERRARVVDTGPQHLCREIGERRWLAPVPGGGEAGMCSARKEDTITLHASRGTVLRHYTLTGKRVEPAVAPHPNGRALVALCRAEPQGGRIGGQAPLQAPIYWVNLMPDGSTGAVSLGRISEGADHYRLVTATSNRTLFLRMEYPSVGVILYAYHWNGEKLACVHADKLPLDAMLVQDAAGERAALLCPTRAGLEVVELNQHAPILAGHDDPPNFDLMRTLIWPRCERLRLGRDEAEMQAERTLLVEALREDDPVAKLQKIIELGRKTPDVLMCLLEALDAGPDRHPTDEMARLIYNAPEESRRVLYGAAPLPFQVGLLHASARARARDWDTVLAALRELGWEAAAHLQPHIQQHIGHLRGMALLFKGQAEDAERELRHAAAIEVPEEERCRLDGLIDLATPLPEVVTLADLSAPTSRMRRLMLMVALADARLAEGDVLGAWEALDRRLVWQEGELQSMARLAQTYLLLRDDHEATIFRKALVLSRFQSLLRIDELLKNRNAPIPGHTLPASELLSLGRRAQAWIDHVCESHLRASLPLDAGPPGPETPPAGI